MKSIGLLNLLAFCMGSTVSAQTFIAFGEDICNYQNNYTLVFEDEFHGSHVDGSKWKTFFSFCADGTDQCPESRVNVDDSETAAFRDENVMVEDGKATISLEDWSDANYSWNTWYGHTRAYTSGVLFSHQTYNEGKFEIRCRIPELPNAFPSFWLFGDGGNEIDVFEFCGGDYDDMRCSIHRTQPQDPAQHHTYHATINGDVSFHTYAVEWVSNWVIWFFDGAEIYRRCRWHDASPNDCSLDGLCTRQIFPADGSQLKVIVSMDYAQEICSGGITLEHAANLDVDYVRVYQNAGALEPNLHNVCDDPSDIISLTDNRDYFCTPGDIIHFKIEGVHGDPIHWTIGGSGANSVEIIDSNNEECWVRCNSIPGNGYEPMIQANDPENPCQPGKVFNKRLYLGRPYISFGDGNLNLNLNCPENDQQHQYWCIDPEVRGAIGISPYPVSSFTTYYYPVAVYNDYDYGWLQDPSIPEPTPTVWYGYSGYRPYRVFVDGKEHTRIFRPEFEWEYGQEGNFVVGFECDYPPLGCQEHWTPWAYDLYPYENGPFCLWKDGDFCHDIVIEASNGCGTTTESFIVADRCVLGPCNYLDPDLPELLNQYVSIYPTPVVASDFTVVMDNRLDLSLVHRIVVKDAMMVERAVVLKPSTRESVISTANWPAGVYYVYVYLESGMQTLKIQVK